MGKRIATLLCSEESEAIQDVQALEAIQVVHKHKFPKYMQFTKGIFMWSTDF